MLELKLKQKKNAATLKIHENLNTSLNHIYSQRSSRRSNGVDKSDNVLKLSRQSSDLAIGDVTGSESTLEAAKSANEAAGI